MKSKADVKALMERVFAECMGTREQAHHEYAQRSETEKDNALANFERRAAELKDVPREKVWYILTAKHWDGVLAWINGNRSNQREDVRGRIKDLIVYLVLLWAMVDDTREAALEPRCPHKVATVQDGDLQCELPQGHEGKHQVTRSIIHW